MKTTKFTSAIATLSLVLFISVVSIAGSRAVSSGDSPKSGDKVNAAGPEVEMDLSYLRFDVNKYVSENEEADLIHSSLDYLRFDVNIYMNENETGITNLPETNEFEYLRFNLDNYTEANDESMTELPENEFDYLRFDVYDFASAGNNELPLAE